MTATFPERWCPPAIGILLTVLVASTFAAGAGASHYVITNDDVPPKLPSSVTFYAAAADGQLSEKKQVIIPGLGTGGGYFAAQRVKVLNGGGQQCLFASDGTTGAIVAIVLPSTVRAGEFLGSLHDTGASNGMGLALNTQYVYASFTDNNTIGTFQILPGCTLSFLGDTTVSGLQGGVIDGMAVHGNVLVATYGDGSIESFDVSAGMPLSHGDEQNSTASQSGNTYPSGVDITQDGHYAIFGDTSTAIVIEVSDISSGKLTKTLVYASQLGISSSDVLLSPDESLLYISNTQGDHISAAFFDKNTGKLSKGCESSKLKGYVTNWSYLGGLTLENNRGTGGAIYVAEFGSPSSIGEVKISSAKGKCTLTELANSPVADAHSPGLLSITSFPPRSF